MIGTQEIPRRVPATWKRCPTDNCGTNEGTGLQGVKNNIRIIDVSVLS